MPTNDEKDVYLIRDGHEEIIGITTEVLEEIDYPGLLALKRTQSIMGEKIDKRVDVYIVGKIDFRRLYYQSEQNSKMVQVDYSQIRVNAFDTSSIEMLLRVLPLQEGYEEIIKAYHGLRKCYLDVKVNVKKGTENWDVFADFGTTKLLYGISTYPQRQVTQKT